MINAVVDSYQNSERAFFESLGIPVPETQFKIFDYRNLPWSSSLSSSKRLTKYVFRDNNQIHYTYINNNRQDKGNMFRSDDLTILHVTYTKHKYPYHFFVVFSNDMYISDYDSLVAQRAF